MNSSVSPKNSTDFESDGEYHVFTSSPETKELIARLSKESRSNDYPALQSVSLPVFTREDLL